MQNYHPAFLGGEIVRVRDAARLVEIQKLCTTDSPINLHTVFPESMTDYAGEQVQITGVSFYHMGFALYELRRIGGGLIKGRWPEDAIEDQELGRADEHELFAVAIERYTAKRSDDGLHVEIRDRGDRLLCSMRKRDVSSAVENVTRVAGLRCAFSFAARYNFEDDPPESDKETGGETVTNESG
tara:strand:- start:108 stop:659 length:552 start_codon:yes stop_codon:yes gene_type:complete